MSRLYYPIAVKIINRLVLVAGGGKVAERKVDILSAFGADIKVVSPSLTPRLKRFAGSQKIKWLKRKVAASDLAGASIVIAATSDREVNKKVSGWAERRGIPVNVVDQAESSSFISPAVFRASKAVVAVYTEGKDPVLSRDMKNFIKENWDAFLSYRNRL